MCRKFYFIFLSYLDRIELQAKVFKRFYELHSRALYLNETCLKESKDGPNPRGVIANFQ